MRLCVKCTGIILTEAIKYAMKLNKLKTEKY